MINKKLKFLQSVEFAHYHLLLFFCSVLLKSLLIGHLRPVDNFLIKNCVEMWGEVDNFVILQRYR